MKIISKKALRGPNYYSRHPVILMELDIENLEFTPTDLVPGFRDNIHSMMPSLYQHTCSPGRIGGFYERLKSGTWAGHVVEHVALELQCLIGHEVSFGKTYTMEEEGIYKLVFRYIDEDTGLRAGEMAVRIVDRLFKGIVTNVEPLIRELRKIADSSMLGPSTSSIVNEAQRRGIEYIRLNDNNYVQLGQGVNQRRIEATMTDDTSALAVEIAGDKSLTKSILSSMGIPVAKGYSVVALEEAFEVADKIGYPIVIKPVNGNHGRGITTGIMDQKDLSIAFGEAKEISNTVIIEKHLYGLDFRILVIDGKFVAAAQREPAFVVGNDADSIQTLIEKTNADPQRGIGHEKNLTQIEVDVMTLRVLRNQKMTLDSVPERDQKVYLKDTGNLSSGGIATDVTDQVHPQNRLMAERVSKLIGLNIMGIDIIADTLEIPLQEQACGILEVNAGPGFRMHLSPTKGTPRNIGAHVVNMLFPPGSKHAIPIVSVTGTNGKTTTTRLIAHILSANGKSVGMTSTDGVVINNNMIFKGDYSGPEGARIVLTDPTVDHAVIEVARGGILRRGLGFKEADVGVLMNITSDHLGMEGVNTLEELARVKSTVTESVKKTGYAVFNADDPLVLSCIEKTQASSILFSLNPDNEAIQDNLEKGNMNVIYEDEMIFIQQGLQKISIVNSKEVPITFEGKALFNIQNAMAAVAATKALGMDEIQIKNALMSFYPSVEQSAGRMNMIDMGDFMVLIDYGHNPGAILATGEFVKSLAPGRIIRLSAASGNRREVDILDFAASIAKYSDHVVLCDSDPRGRELGATPELVRCGLLDNGFEEHEITLVLDEREAALTCLQMAQKGDLVVLQVDDIEQIVKDVLDYKNKL